MSFIIPISQMALTSALIKQQPQAFIKTQPLPNEATPITDKTINLFYDTQFQKEFKNVVKNVDMFKNSIDNFKKHLTTFSKQLIEFQKHYDNFEQLFIPFEKIYQKPLTIAIIKLLQYKNAANKANLASANQLINNLEKVLSDIDDTLKSLAEKPEWTSTYFNPSSKVSAKHSIEKVFKDTIHTKYPFKVKKVKRAIQNWKKT